MKVEICVCPKSKYWKLFCLRVKAEIVQILLSQIVVGHITSKTLRGYLRMTPTDSKSVCNITSTVSNITYWSGPFKKLFTLF